MLIEVNENTFLNLIEDKIRYWENDDVIVELYRNMYSNRLDNGFYDEDTQFNLNSVVDNDITNYTDIIDKEDYPEDFQLLLESYESDEMNVSTIDFNNISANQIEAYDSYNEIFLVSYYG